MYILQDLTSPFDRATYLFWPPDQTSIRSPERLTITLSNKKSFRFSQPGSIQNFQPNILPAHPSGVHSISNQISFQITQPRSIQNFQLNILPNHPARIHFKISRKSPSVDPISYPFTRTRKIPSQYRINRPFTKTPRETPSINPTYHPSCYFTNTTATHPTHTPSYIWAIPGPLGGHTGHTLLLIKAGHHFWVQDRIQSCIQS